MAPPREPDEENPPAAEEGIATTDLEGYLEPYEEYEEEPGAAEEEPLVPPFDEEAFVTEEELAADAEATLEEERQADRDRLLAAEEERDRRRLGDPC